MKYIIANFKSHKTKSEIESWLDSYSLTPPPDTQIILALPYPYLHLIKPGTSTKLDVAAQDVSPFPAGSYTGAVNATQLADLGVKYCLVGHSERRRYFHETSVEVSNKVEELLSVGITPIVCVSEDDLSSQFAALAESTISRCLFAYETLADIGGTDTTPVDEIERVITLLKGYTKSSSLGLLYGGSVNENNVDTLCGVVDGLIVATASLDPNSFEKVIQGFASHV